MFDSSSTRDSQIPATHAEPPDLAVFDNDYRATKPVDTGGLPDGKYTVRVGDVQLGHSQKGDPMLTWTLVVLRGEHANRHISKNSVITKASLPFVKADLETVGLELPRFSVLAHHLDRLVGRALEITRRTKGEYVNVSFDKRIPALDAGSPDDIPF